MADMSDIETVWVFNGSRSQFPSGVFTTLEAAEAWIRRYGLTGTLTRYPLDQSAYDWAISRSYFRSTKPEHNSPEFIGRFSEANQEHYHYENGSRD
jgi:hypothetical protein